MYKVIHKSSDMLFLVLLLFCKQPKKEFGTKYLEEKEVIALNSPTISTNRAQTVEIKNIEPKLIQSRSGSMHLTARKEFSYGQVNNEFSFSNAHYYASRFWMP